jgi:hypothetical protein
MLTPQMSNLYIENRFASKNSPTPRMVEAMVGHLLRWPRLDAISHTRNLPAPTDRLRLRLRNEIKQDTLSGIRREKTTAPVLHESRRQ